MYTLCLMHQGREGGWDFSYSVGEGWGDSECENNARLTEPFARLAGH